MSISNYAENKILDAIFNNVSFAVAQVYVKLHTGDPGEDGTANAAAETDRVAGSFTAAASGAVSNDAVIEWLAVAATETYSHVSFWDASTGGNCLWTGALTTPKAVTAGDNARFPIGDLDVAID